MTNDEQFDEYIVKDNIKRYCLKDMLTRRDALKGLTLEEIDSLTCDCVVLLSNIESQFERSEIKIGFGDELNWSSNSLVRDIFTHTVLDIKPICNDSTKRLNNKLKRRWTEDENVDGRP